VGRTEDGDRRAVQRLLLELHRIEGDLDRDLFQSGMDELLGVEPTARITLVDVIASLGAHGPLPVVQRQFGRDR
jgi:hypothetical protein